MSLLERVFYFHQEVLQGHFPNSRTVSAQFEVSAATAKRDIVYLRDRLLAPLVFNHEKNGYFYQEDGFSLPFENSPRVIFLLTMLNDVLFTNLFVLKVMLYEHIRKVKQKIKKCLCACYQLTT